MKLAFNLAEVIRVKHTSTYQRKDAFTLAEVLITLGIIGVVAALTMPVLIANHKKKVAVTRLKKFYSIMNQAVQQSVVDNGDAKNWTMNSMSSPQDLELFFNTYLAKYIIYTETSPEISTINSDGSTLYNKIVVYLPDSSAFFIVNSANNTNKIPRDIHFYPKLKGRASKSAVAGDYKGKTYLNGRDMFSFFFDTDNNRIIPYGYHMVGDNLDPRNFFKNNSRFGCSTDAPYMCASLIMYDGWEIAKDYPIGF